MASEGADSREPGARSVRLEMLSTRTAPDGSWTAGQVLPFPMTRALDLVAAKTAKLAEGETLDERRTGVVEIAALDAGQTPEQAVRSRTRERAK